ncbi:hypothetical protein KYJ26_11735 [Bacillus sp. MCCB 382]|uniref:hypothetical protein n=1 Tax=Bacillus sp. MCCB 382 TaxID=2860197 RepID=UPI001C5740CE|nr:hypothetical protein [Bacillus sp. MCCB 382]
MLTFNEARTIFLSYSELQETMSGERYSYSVRYSAHRGKQIAKEISCNQDGSFNGYIFSRYMGQQMKEKYKEHIDPREMIKIKSFTREQLNAVIMDAISAMGQKEKSFIVERPVEKVVAEERVEEDNPSPELVRSCLYNWLGYGNPNGAIWFIGTEEGGAEIWRQKTTTLHESLQLRKNFHLHMDFYDVWENQYQIDINSFKGATVWNYCAALLLSMNNEVVNSSSIRDFIFNEKRLGSKRSNHYLCELYPLPKRQKNVIAPYEHIWNSVAEYYKETSQKRIQLLIDTLLENKDVKLLVAYERDVLHLLKEHLDSIILVDNWSYKKQQYALYEIRLDTKRKIALLSTPFFGQGQISYDGLKDTLNHISEYM